jgi:hypothetical protein
MAAPTITDILDNVGTSTLEARLPGLVDNVFTGNPLAARLLQRDNVKVDGGKDIRQRIIYGKKGGGSYSGLDPLDNTNPETRTELVFNWKQLYVPIMLSGLDMMKNAGTHQISDLVQDEMDEAEIRAADIVGEQIYGDGTGNLGKDLTGLRAVCDDGTLITTYGGITRSSTANTPGLAASCPNITTTGIAFSLAAMQVLASSATVGYESVDMIITTKALYSKWWERAQPSQRFNSTDANRPVNIGFSQISMDGAAVVVDEHCPSGHVYFLNTKYLKFCIHPERVFTPTGWKYPVNQDSAIQQLFFGGELVCSSPRLQALATNVS